MDSSILANIKQYRTHTCGVLNKSDESKTVTLCGWVQSYRDHGGIVFIDLRDRYGITQITFDPALKECEGAYELSSKLRSEYVIRVTGKVRARPGGMANKKMPTGEIEVVGHDLILLSEAETPPFPIDDEINTSEVIRLQYRYLDLRRKSMQENLLTRAKMISSIRKVLESHQFMEVETPILYKSTPEGARDFIVPSRLQPREFYALPQSPQTLKQLLMISGWDRYYQVARCFRDEDLRADRQPEFSQIDIEASFMTEEEFFPIMEEMVCRVWKDAKNIDLPRPFPRMSFEEAMTQYGSDKPDTRFGLKLQNLSNVFEKSEFKVFQQALAKNEAGKSGTIRGIVVQGGAEKFSRKDLDDLSALAVSHGAKGLLWMKVQESGELQSPAAKFFKPEEIQNLKDSVQLKPGDLLVCVSDQNDRKVCESLGAVRVSMGKKLGVIPPVGEGVPHIFWIHQFPLLEYNDADGRYYAAHHPFTSPRAEYMQDFLEGKNLREIKANAYDMVCNGHEIGGGSIRIFRKDLQAKMFEILGFSFEEARAQFGFFIDALKYGTPPHGGMAFGVERMTAILCNEEAIREVMAFPKTQKGQCLMSGAPSEVNPMQLAELGVSVRAKKEG